MFLTTALSKKNMENTKQFTLNFSKSPNMPINIILDIKTNLKTNIAYVYVCILRAEFPGGIDFMFLTIFSEE
jgi:hypothetical protein